MEENSLLIAIQLLKTEQTRNMIIERLDYHDLNLVMNKAAYEIYQRQLVAQKDLQFKLDRIVNEIRQSGLILNTDKMKIEVPKEVKYDESMS